MGKRVAVRKRNSVKPPPQKNRIQYRVKNWPEYNQALVQRGDITIWFDATVAQQWRYTGKQKQGAPLHYSAVAIQTALLIRSVFSLPLRSCQGFLTSVITLLGFDLEVPDYSTLCRRQRTLELPPVQIPPGHEPLHLVVDSTGLKVFGEGEWKVRQHGYSKHRTWRKLHLAVDPATGEVLANALTTNSVADAEVVPALVDAVTEPIASFTGDGAYDHWMVYTTLQQRQIRSTIPPRKNARIKQHGNRNAAPLPRDEAIRAIRASGRQHWKQATGYHRRSLAETAMFRYKTQFGDRLLASSLENQKVEVGINCLMLNRFTALGKPISYPVQG